MKGGPLKPIYYKMLFSKSSLDSPTRTASRPLLLPVRLVHITPGGHLGPSSRGPRGPVVLLDRPDWDLKKKPLVRKAGKIVTPGQNTIRFWTNIKNRISMPEKRIHIYYSKFTHTSTPKRNCSSGGLSSSNNSLPRLSPNHPQT